MQKSWRAADERDQLVGVGEAAFGRDEAALPGRRVAAQGEDVADAAVPQVVEDAADLVGGVADAGQVGHRADADLVLDLLDQLDGLLPRAPAGAVGDGDVARLERAQVLDRLVELREARLVLRREELERDGGLALAQDLVDPHARRF